MTVRTAPLLGSELPVPSEESAYKDNNGRIWLWSPDPPSRTGIWRIPGGTLSKATNPTMDAALKKFDVKSLVRMAPVRRRSG